MVVLRDEYIFFFFSTHVDMILIFEKKIITVILIKGGSVRSQNLANGITSRRSLSSKQRK